jgi:hypothetical protein
MNSISSHQQSKKGPGKNFSSNHNTPKKNKKTKKSLQSRNKNSCLITFVSSSPLLRFDEKIISQLCATGLVGYYSKQSEQSSACLSYDFLQKPSHRLDCYSSCLQKRTSWQKFTNLSVKVKKSPLYRRIC